MLFLFRSAPEVEKRMHSKLFRKFWRSRGTKEPTYITVLQSYSPDNDIDVVPVNSPRLAARLSHLAPHRLCQRARTAGTARMIDFNISPLSSFVMIVFLTFLKNVFINKNYPQNRIISPLIDFAHDSALPGMRE